MRPLAQIILPAGLMVLAAGWAASDNPPQTQSFVGYCAFVGANLTGDHWLGAFCRNNMTSVFGYNYTWIDLDLCVGNNGSQLVPYDNGNYSTSCTDCSTSAKPKETIILTCSCQDLNRHFFNSSLDLSNGPLWQLIKLAESY
ncbi:uncharacterized protein B0H64DRAFT_449816 [Chaetomium fimeti]|uniref:Cyanovirin-N domain-containing protein n=1 Tax=Chaetomium fimeti TaxID=1854472 RepID=A0AAE0HR81_9PEZI|nr:hypothetical protein B0H64DRAFT_449816 [Chaetomium fimeti]